MNADPQSSSWPLISVVIPTNNRKHWLCEAIDTVFAQTYPNIELIVVDDGSSDGTSELIKERYADRLTLLRTEGTSCGEAKNFGAQHANGEYVSFLDDDDLWYSQKLEKQYSMMTSGDESVAVVGGGCDYITSDGKPTLAPSLPNGNQATYDQLCIKVQLPGSGSNHLIKKSIFDEMRGFDISLIRAQDRDLWIRIARNYRILLVPDILCSIRIHDNVRRGVNLDVIERSRREINRRIPEPDLKRIADGWLYYQLFGRAWESDKSLALKYLISSFRLCFYSGRMPTNRMKGFVRTLLNR